MVMEDKDDREVEKEDKEDKDKKVEKEKKLNIPNSFKGSDWPLTLFSDLCTMNYIAFFFITRLF